MGPRLRGDDEGRKLLRNDEKIKTQPFLTSNGEIESLNFLKLYETIKI